MHNPDGCVECGLVPGYFHPDPVIRHLLHLLERTDRTMTDFATATTDAINELGTLAEELIAALKATPAPDPAVQDAADRLEAAVNAAKSSDPTPASPPADTPSTTDQAPASTDPGASTGDAPPAGSVPPIPDTTGATDSPPAGDSTTA